MKLFYTLIFGFLLTLTVNAQDRYLTKNGAITFYSKAPMEDITADNNQVLSIIDATKGKMAISILMKSFQFKKALMQEHFNENYVESDKFPKATFSGSILNFDAIRKKETIAKVKGVLTIHGVSKEITIQANFSRTKDFITVKGDFIINVDDYNIKIPAVVAKNIANKITVSFSFNHKPFKK